MAPLKPAILFNADGDLRSGWKFLLYVVAFLLLGYASVQVLSRVYPFLPIPDGELTMIGVSVLIRFVPAILATVLLARLVDHVPLAAFGVALHDRWLRDFLTGLVVAAAMLSALLLAAALLGDLDIHWNSGFPLGAWFLTVAILLMSAASEELMFRGYPMQVLMKGIGAFPAMLIMSTLFGVLHIFNPNASILSTFNTVVAGFMLSLAYFRTRSLWFPYGLHLGWNLAVGPIVGFTISGVDFPSLFRTRLGGVETITGGGYGPEGGFLGTLIFACGAVAVWSVVKVRVSPQLRTTIAQNAVKVYAADL